MNCVLYRLTYFLWILYIWVNYKALVSATPGQPLVRGLKIFLCNPPVIIFANIGLCNVVEHGWFLEKIFISEGKGENRVFQFPCQRWFSSQKDDGQIVRDVCVSGRISGKYNQRISHFRVEKRTGSSRLFWSFGETEINNIPNMTSRKFS